jgi:CBS domain containing-hemolysin-like protein
VTGLLVLLAIALALLLFLSTYVQLLYLETQRLRTRESRALELFKETFEDRIGVKADQGALAFSLIKHTSLLLMGIVFLAISAGGGGAFWHAASEAAILSFATMIMVAYLLPQFLYRRATATWLTPLLPLLRVMTLAVKPLTLLLGFLQSLADLSEPERTKEEEQTPAENIEALITAGQEEGLIEEDDRRLIQSVVEFGDKRVREVMTPRPNIVAIENNRSLEELRQLVINEQYSRIPVFEGSIDNIIGFVHVRDMFELDEADREHRKVAELVRELKPVPETKRVCDLLREMQQNGAHMAVVVDEYGNTAGIATMEDLVEEVFGEIRDEHEPTADIEEEPDGSYVVSGSFDLDHLHELVAFRPEEEMESTTVGGLVTEWLGHVPKKGEIVEQQGIKLEVVAGNDLRVDKVRISKSGNGAPHA